MIIVLVCLIVGFKMHSYLLTNLEYRESYQNTKRRLSESEFRKVEERSKSKGFYPYNITAANYLRYLSIPGVVYEQNFPTSEKFNPLYFLGHVSFLIGNLLVQYTLFSTSIAPIVRNEKLQWDLYRVSQLKRDVDEQYGVASSTWEGQERSSRTSSSDDMLQQAFEVAMSLTTSVLCSLGLN